MESLHLRGASRESCHVQGYGKRYSFYVEQNHSGEADRHSAAQEVTYHPRKPKTRYIHKIPTVRSIVSQFNQVPNFSPCAFKMYFN
jgi:hypothetical protein